MKHPNVTLAYPDKTLTHTTNTLICPHHHTSTRHWHTPVKLTHPNDWHTPKTHWQPLIGPQHHPDPWRTHWIWPNTLKQHFTHIDTHGKEVVSHTPSYLTRHTQLPHPPCDSMLFWQFTGFPLGVAWDITMPHLWWSCVWSGGVTTAGTGTGFSNKLLAIPRGLP